MQTSPYSSEDRQRWKGLLLAKGSEVASKLEEVLAKKDVTLEDLGLFMVDDAKEPKEKRLRRYFDHLMTRMRAVNDPRFGYDRERDRFLTIAELDAMPWIECEP